MSIMDRTAFLAKGHYDDTGHWKRDKFCFRSCGDRCDCGPPHGKYYSEAHDKRLLNKPTSEPK